MLNLYVAGASGAIGIRFVKCAIRNYTEISKFFLIYSTITGKERLMSELGSYENVEYLPIHNLIFEDDSLKKNVFLNFAYVSTGTPWSRIKNNYKLVAKFCQFAKDNDFNHYIEISSQSVFGFSFENNVFIDSIPSIYCEEYGITKFMGEKAVQEYLSSSKCSYTIVRLGNVFFENSGPFMQRIINLGFSDKKDVLKNDGYINGTLLPNTLSGIRFVFNNFHNLPNKSVYHFSEISHFRWSFIGGIVNEYFHELNFCNVVKDYKKNKKSFLQLLILFLKSKYSGPLLVLLSKVVPQSFEIFFEGFYRERRLSFYFSESKFDLSVLKSFEEKNRFLPYFPLGYRYEIPPVEFEMYLLKIFKSQIPTSSKILSDLVKKE
jgi:hypothetical protein